MITPRPSRTYTGDRFPIGSLLFVLLGVFLMVTGVVNYTSVQSHCSHDHGLVVKVPVSPQAPFGFRCIEQGQH